MKGEQQTQLLSACTSIMIQLNHSRTRVSSRTITGHLLLLLLQQQQQQLQLQCIRKGGESSAKAQ